ncbi:uncharacterized protein LOC135390790 isoform X2 [Ornithodoros turicata]
MFSLVWVSAFIVSAVPATKITEEQMKVLLITRAQEGFHVRFNNPLHLNGHHRMRALIKGLNNFTLFTIVVKYLDNDMSGLYLKDAVGDGLGATRNIITQDGRLLLKTVQGLNRTVMESDHNVTLEEKTPYVIQFYALPHLGVDIDGIGVQGRMYQNFLQESMVLETFCSGSMAIYEYHHTYLPTELQPENNPNGTEGTVGPHSVFLINDTLEFPDTVQLGEGGVIRLRGRFMFEGNTTGPPATIFMDGKKVALIEPSPSVKIVLKLFHKRLLLEVEDVRFIQPPNEVKEWHYDKIGKISISEEFKPSNIEVFTEANYLDLRRNDPDTHDCQ